MSQSIDNAAASILSSETLLQESRLGDGLAERLKILIDSAQRRVCAMRDKEDADYVKREQRLQLFAASKQQIRSLLIDRLGILTEQETFSDAIRTYDDVAMPETANRSGGDATALTWPASAHRPTRMQIAFHVFHDSNVQNTIIEYRLSLLPIFVRFNANDQRVIPIGDEAQQGLADWIDAKIVTFVQTYFEVYFHPEYQKPHSTIDPVMGIAFPKFMAVQTRQLQGRTAHFFTDESVRNFNANAASHPDTSLGPRASKGLS
tara:strand:+ start:400782 stop:401567 length:786 start_codon:yes stop_codon:yes gene_type:complete